MWLWNWIYVLTFYENHKNMQLNTSWTKKNNNHNMLMHHNKLASKQVDNRMGGIRFIFHNWNFNLFYWLVVFHETNKNIQFILSACFLCFCFVLLTRMHFNHLLLILKNDVTFTSVIHLNLYSANKNEKWESVWSKT